MIVFPKNNFLAKQKLLILKNCVLKFIGKVKEGGKS